MLDVPNVGLNTAGDVLGAFDFTAKAGHLRPSGNAGLHPLAYGKVGYQLGIFLGVLDHVRTGTHEGHIAQEYVDELGDFVDARLAKEVSDFGGAAIVLGSLDEVRFIVLLHAAEFVDVEFLAMLAGPFLLEDDGASSGSLDKNCYYDEDEREKQTEEKSRNYQVECPLDDSTDCSFQFVLIGMLGVVLTLHS